MFDWIAFDADDTLWQNEEYYAQGRDLFRALLARYGLPDVADEEIDAVEIANLPYYGYGAMSFILSLVEAGIRLTGGQIASADIEALLAHGKRMLNHPVEVYPHAAAVLQTLTTRYPLVVITKGDLRHQAAKVAESGLEKYFRHVEVVSDKNEDTYRGLMQRLGAAPDRFLMVGNSLRSDILPAVAAGGRGVYIPNRLTWSHEHSHPTPDAAARFWQLSHLGELPGLLAELENVPGVGH